jgi:WD40 repeat protein
MKTWLLSILFTALLLRMGTGTQATAEEAPARLREHASLGGDGRIPVVWHFGCLAFSGDNKLLASVDWTNGIILLWDVARGKAAGVLQHRGARSAAFSADSKMLASYGARETKLWDVASWKNTATLRGDSPKVYGIVFSSDGKTLTTIERWGLKVWDLEKKEELRDIDLPCLATPVSSYPSVKRPLVATESPTRTVGSSSILVDAITGESVFDCGWHRNGLSQFAMDRNETMIAVGGMDDSVQLWSRITGGRTVTFRDALFRKTTCLALSPDGKILAIGFTHSRGNFSDGGFRLREVPSGKILAESNEHPLMVVALVFSPDGRWLATAGATGGPIKLWSVPAAWRKKK